MADLTLAPVRTAAVKRAELAKSVARANRRSKRSIVRLRKSSRRRAGAVAWMASARGRGLARTVSVGARGLTRTASVGARGLTRTASVGTRGLTRTASVGARGSRRTASARLRGARRTASAGLRGFATWTVLTARGGFAAVKIMLRVPPPEPRPTAPRAAQMTAAALAGATAEFLLDPADGKRRRRQLRDRAAATGRRLGRRGSQRTRYLMGQAEGVLHRTTSSASPPADDQALADRVRTEIFRRAGAPKGAVNVGVVDGVVYLRGEIAEQSEVDRLIADARSVPGVRAIENMLHPPGVPAPQGGAA